MSVGNNDYMVTLTRQSEILEEARKNRDAGEPWNYFGQTELPDGPVVRIVTVNDSKENEATSKEETLERIFFYGQNDFQPRDGCISVSVGDIVHLPDGENGWSHWAVAGFGFVELEGFVPLPGEDFLNYDEVMTPGR
jgi:hypothetical protein